MLAAGPSPFDIDTSQRRDWDNREFAQRLADTIRVLSNFLENFEGKINLQLSEANERLDRLEKLMSFVETTSAKKEHYDT